MWTVFFCQDKLEIDNDALLLEIESFFNKSAVIANVKIVNLHDCMSWFSSNATSSNSNNLEIGDNRRLSMQHTAFQCSSSECQCEHSNDVMQLVNPLLKVLFDAVDVMLFLPQLDAITWQFSWLWCWREQRLHSGVAWLCNWSKNVSSWDTAVKISFSQATRMKF